MGPLRTSYVESTLITPFIRENTHKTLINPQHLSLRPVRASTTFPSLLLMSGVGQRAHQPPRAHCFGRRHPDRLLRWLECCTCFAAILKRSAVSRWWEHLHQSFGLDVHGCTVFVVQSSLSDMGSDAAQYWKILLRQMSLVFWLFGTLMARSWSAVSDSGIGTRYQEYSQCYQV